MLFLGVGCVATKSGMFALGAGGIVRHSMNRGSWAVSFEIVQKSPLRCKGNPLICSTVRSQQRNGLPSVQMRDGFEAFDASKLVPVDGAGHREVLPRTAGGFDRRSGQGVGLAQSGKCRHAPGGHASNGQPLRVGPKPLGRFTEHPIDFKHRVFDHFGHATGLLQIGIKPRSVAG